MSSTALPDMGATATGVDVEGRTRTGTVIAVLHSLRMVVVDTGWRSFGIEPVAHHHNAA